MSILLQNVMQQIEVKSTSTKRKNIRSFLSALQRARIAAQIHCVGDLSKWQKYDINYESIGCEKLKIIARIYFTFQS